MDLSPGEGVIAGWVSASWRGRTHTHTHTQACFFLPGCNETFCDLGRGSKLYSSNKDTHKQKHTLTSHLLAFKWYSMLSLTCYKFSRLVCVCFGVCLKGRRTVVSTAEIDNCIDFLSPVCACVCSSHSTVWNANHECYARIFLQLQVFKFWLDSFFQIHNIYIFCIDSHAHCCWLDGGLCEVCVSVGGTGGRERVRQRRCVCRVSCQTDVHQHFRVFLWSH